MPEMVRVSLVAPLTVELRPLLPLVNTVLPNFQVQALGLAPVAATGPKVTVAPQLLVWPCGWVVKVGAAGGVGARATPRKMAPPEAVARVVGVKVPAPALSTYLKKPLLAPEVVVKYNTGLAPL